MLYDNKLAAASRKSAAAANRPELLRWLLPVLLLVLLLPGTAQSQDRGLRSRSNAELIRRAKGYIEADTMLDRAVEALGVVTSRYYADPENKVARRAAIEAFTQLAGIYSYRIFDFAKAYDNMATARLIAEEEKDDYHLANILSVMANLYVLSGNTDSRTNATIDSLTRMSLYHALKGNNEDVIARHAVNFSLARLQDKGWGEFCKQVDSIRQHKYSKGSVYPFIARDILGGMDAYFAGDYKRAERLLTAAYRRVPDRQYTERYRYGILYLLQYVYDHDGNFTAEERNLRQRLKMATDLHLDDYRMFTLRCLSNFFIRQEQPDSADKYYIEYLIFKDKMTSEGSMSRIGSMEMLRQIQKSDQEIKQLSLQRRRDQQRLRVASSIIFVVLAVAGVLAYLFVQKRRQHKLLYARHRELLDLQERYDKALLSVSSEPAESFEPAESPQPAPRSEADAEALRRVYARIVRFMESSDEIYSSGFGLEELVSRMHESRRTVSTAINFCSGGNFHQFLNTYRIRSACRLMQTEDRSSRTVEYIAEACGFRSRTSFASLFKKSTGLTPTDYWKMAAEGTDPATPPQSEVSAEQ